MASRGGLRGFSFLCASEENVDTQSSNVASNFTVKPARPLDFSGQSFNEDVTWEVGVQSFHYTNDFFNFNEACVLRIIVGKPPANEVDTSEASAAGCVAYTSGQAQEGLDDVDAALLPLHRIASSVVRGKEIEFPLTEMLFGRIHLTVGYYQNVSLLWRDVVEKFNRIFGPRYMLQLQVTLRANGAISISLTNGRAVAIYSDTCYIAKLLGLPATPTDVIIADRMRSDIVRTVKLQRLGLDGSCTPKLDGVQSLSIYCDIIQYQYVGKEMLPLLAYVGVEGSPRERVDRYFDPVVYMPVSKSTVNSIAIRICDDHGNFVKFSNDTKNVICLLFRRSSRHGLRYS